MDIQKIKSDNMIIFNQIIQNRKEQREHKDLDLDDILDNDDIIRKIALNSPREYSSLYSLYI